MKILITGGNGFVGRYVSTELKKFDHKVYSPNHNQMDCSNPLSVDKALEKINPELIIHTAAFIMPTDKMKNNHKNIFEKNKNLNSNILKAASKKNIKNILCFGSHTMYSNDSKKNEKNILENNPPSFIEGYANSKRLLFKECQKYCTLGLNYKMLVLPSIYGPFDLKSPPKQMLNSVILRALESKKNNKRYLEIYGDLSALREYIFLPDLTDWIIKKVNFIDSLPVALNLGTNSLLSVLEYYKICSKLINIELKLDNESVKLIKDELGEFPLDCSLAQNFGWENFTSIEEGIIQTIRHIEGHYGI